MKINVEIECSPEEARSFMGLPDVKDVNAAYVGGIKEAISNTTDLEKIQKFTQNIAPMGEMGMRFFQQMMDAGSSRNKK